MSIATHTKRWVLISVIVLLLLMYWLKPILMPFVVGALLSYLADPLVERLTSLRMPRIAAVFLVFVGLFGIIVGGLVILLPLIEHQVVLFIERVPGFVAWFNQRVIPLLDSIFGIKIELFDPQAIRQAVSQYWQQAGSFVGQFLSVVTRSGLQFILWAINIVLIPVVTFYLLRDWNDIIKMVQGVIPDHLKGLVNKLVSECDEVLSAFIRGQLLVMLGLGIIYAVGLQLVGLDMAILIGMIAGLFSVVPYLGFAVGLLVGIIAGLVQYSGDLWALLPIILVFCVGSLIESMVLTPWLVGDRIGLHPVAVIFAVLAGGQMFGFVGVFLALPVASVLMVWVRYVYNEYTSSNWYATGQEGPSLDDS